MLANPTPAQAFPTRTALLATYFAQNPVWVHWSRTSQTLWTAAPTLDQPGLTVAQQIGRRAAWTLDTLLSQAPADVGVWRQLAPTVAATWRVWQTWALLTPPAHPTQTLALTPGAQGALDVLNQWDAVQQHHVPPQPGSLLAIVCQGVRIVPAPHSSATPPQQVFWHLLTADDTLPQLAERYLGDAEQWPIIRQANHLRAPFISARLWDQYGPPVLAYELTNASTASPFVAAPPVSAGATTITLPGATPPQCPPGAVIVLETWTATGRQQETVTVQSFNPATQVATVTSAVQANYGAGALLSVNWPPAWYTTQVLAPGQALAIPLNTAPSAALPEPTDPWGTDLEVDTNNDLVWTSTGDVKTVSGPANLAAALARRLDTALGSVVLHPTYGSLLPTIPGTPMEQPYVIQGAVTTALLADPRVQRVRTVSVTAQDTTWQVAAVVDVTTQPQPITVTTTLG